VLFPESEDVPVPGESWTCISDAEYPCRDFRVVGLERIDARTLIIRTARIEPYCGGFGAFELTHVVHHDGLRPRHLLALPSAYFALYAGEWNDDGTREHWVQEAELEIEFAASGSEGPPDLRVRVGGATASRLLRWDRNADSFRCATSAP